MLVALVFVAAACSDRPQVAATVDGATITVADVEGELRAIEGNEDYLGTLIGSPGGNFVTGEAPETFQTSFVAQVLTRQIQIELLRQELADRGVVLTDEDLEAGRAEAAIQVGSGDPDAGEALLGEFPDDYQRYLATTFATVDRLQALFAGVEDFSTESLEAYYEANTAQFEEACTSHVLVETEAEADRVVRRLDRGEDLADVAEDVSLDEGSAANGGEVGCRPRGFLQPEYEEAAFAQEVGEVGEPVQTVFGFHVIVVTERRTPDFDDAADDIRARLETEGNEAFGEWFTAALNDTPIEVDPRFGEWFGPTGRVVSPDEAGNPPAGP